MSVTPCLLPWGLGYYHGDWVRGVVSRGTVFWDVSVTMGIRLGVYSASVTPCLLPWGLG